VADLVAENQGVTRVTRPSGSSPSVLLVALLVGAVVLVPTVAVSAPAEVDDQPSVPTTAASGPPAHRRCAEHDQDRGRRGPVASRGRPTGTVLDCGPSSCVDAASTGEGPGVESPRNGAGEDPTPQVDGRSDERRSDDCGTDHDGPDVGGDPPGPDADDDPPGPDEPHRCDAGDEQRAGDGPGPDGDPPAGTDADRDPSAFDEPDRPDEDEARLGSGCPGPDGGSSPGPDDREPGSAPAAGTTSSTPIDGPDAAGPEEGSRASTEAAPLPDDEKASASGSGDSPHGAAGASSTEAPAARSTADQEGERVERALTLPVGSAAATRPFGGRGDAGLQAALRSARIPATLSVVGAALVAVLLVAQSRLARRRPRAATVARLAGRGRRFE
jgi:hypothetical protein